MLLPHHVYEGMITPYDLSSFAGIAAFFILANKAGS
jgi:hypothetical protein